MTDISYCITACNEAEELTKLIQTLKRTVRYKQDEVILLLDQTNASAEVLEVAKDPIFAKVISHPLNRDFATFKNQFFLHATKDYIFQIDADEIPSDNLIQMLPALLDGNLDIDLFLVPRVNIVAGITKAHVEKWNWQVDFNGWINFPDYQHRIYRNSPNIRWKGKVHETISGFKTYSFLPKESSWSLFHDKDITKQEKQNEFYATY